MLNVECEACCSRQCATSEYGASLLCAMCALDVVLEWAWIEQTVVVRIWKRIPAPLTQTMRRAFGVLFQWGM